MAQVSSEISDSFIDLANRLADASRPILRSYYRRKLDVDIKSDASPVTRADREAEAFRSRWDEQLESASGGDPEIFEALLKMWSDREHWSASLR